MEGQPRADVSRPQLLRGSFHSQIYYPVLVVSSPFRLNLQTDRSAIGSLFNDTMKADSDLG